MVAHEITYATSRMLGSYSATCSCGGWSVSYSLPVSDREKSEARSSAARHAQGFGQ
jgi:hypothetical protein